LVLVGRKEQVATGMLETIQFLILLRLMVVDTDQIMLQMVVLVVLAVAVVGIVQHELVELQMVARDMLEVLVMTVALGRQAVVVVQALLD
jgi:hypothetical protein